MQLAKKAEALYALYANVDYTLEGAVVVTGRVVRDDGKVASATQTVKLAKGKDPFKDIAKNGLVQLFSQLKVGELPAERPVEAPKVVEPPKKVEPVFVEPPPPLPPVVVEDKGAGQRAAGKGVLFAGAGVAIVGAALAGVGAGIGGSVQLNSDGTAKSVGDAQNLATGRTLSTVGFVGVGVGAATAIVGAIVWGSAAPPPAQLSVMPVVGGGMVQIGGQF